MDKFGFKKLMFIITILEIIIGSTLYFIVDYKDIYILELLFVASCIGGTYTILAPTFVKIFSLYIGTELYGITGISIGLSNIIGPLFMQLLTEENKSYLIIFLTGVGLCLIKLIILIFFDENKKMYKQNIPMTNILPVNDNENDNMNNIKNENENEDEEEN